MTDMLHMNYLEAVAASDVSHVRHKELTYMGSWKRRGGVGAFMMMARKWDRLEGMLGLEDGTQYNIFAAIEAKPGGEDGTALAEIRDLRRYLLLVESEMMSRSAIEAARKKAEALEAVAKRGVSMTERRVPRHVLPVNPCVAEMPKVKSTLGPRTPEDGGQHPSLAPWVCDGVGYFTNQIISNDLSAKFWNKRAPGLFVLEPWVDSENIPRCLQGIYNMRGNTWTLKIERVPPDSRQFFPNLRLEKNMMEWEALPEWQRVLYTWDDNGSKYKLAEVNLAWHMEEE